MPQNILQYNSFPDNYYRIYRNNLYNNFTVVFHYKMRTRIFIKQAFIIKPKGKP